MRQDFVFALRQVIRQPGLSAAAVLTLGLGLAASLAVFTLIDALLLRPLPYLQPDRVVSINRGPTQFRSSHRDVDFLREHVRTCGPIASMVSGSGLNASIDGVTSYEDDRLVSHQYFDALGIRPQWGRGFTPAEDADPPAPVVVLNERFVRRIKQDASSLIGRDIELGGRPYTVIGVLSAAHTLPSDPAIYRPLGRDPRGSGENLAVVCRLADGASVATLNAELVGLLEEARRRKLADDRTTVPYSAETYHEWLFGGLRPQLTTLLFAVVLVLLAAAANTTGLLLVRASGRRREIAVRTALGAAPGRIIRTLVVEGLALAAMGGLVGLLGVPLLVGGLLAIAPPYYGELAAFEIDGVVVGAAVLLCVSVGVSVALPALTEVLRVNVRDTLQEEGRSGSQARRTLWVRQLLIGAETAVSAVLLVGALLLLQTFLNLMNVDTGVDSRNVVTARISIQGPRYDDVEQVIRFFEEGVRRLEQSPGIESAAVGASLPAERALNLRASFPDGVSIPRTVNWRYVTPSYFTLLRIPSVAGRLFSEADQRGGPLVAVVSETFAKLVYGDVQKALGHLVAVVKEPAREIVGVVPDTTGWSLNDPPRAMLYVPLAQVEASPLRIAHQFFPPRWIVRARDLDTARYQLNAVIRGIDPSQPFIEIQTLDAMMANSVGTERFYFVVLSAFAIFAVLLAAVGIFAAYSYAIASRTKEIGVRLALGATPGRILAGVVGRALALGAVATSVGLMAAAAGARLLQSVLYHVSVTDPLTYVAVAAVLLAIVALATWIPALRASRVDPLVALRR